jgi:outer membrane protein insertion porin family
MVRHLVLHFALALPLVAQQYPIVSLRTTGSERYESKQIVAATNLKEDITTPIPLTQVRDAAQRLAASGVFKEVNYRHTTMAGGMRVEFIVKDNDEEQFVPAAFENFVWFAPDELEAELRKRLALYNGDVSLSGNQRDEIAGTLKEMLATKGVDGHVSSEPRMHLASGEPDAVLFKVDNITVTIARVDFPGASTEILKLLESPKQKLIGAPYQRSFVKQYADSSLRRVYLLKGYLKAAFAEPKPDVLSNEPGATKVTVVLPVTEGRQYTFAGVSWNSTGAMTEKDLTQFLHLYPNLVVNGAILEDDVFRIRQELQTRGFMHAKVAAAPVFNDETGQVSYTVNVAEGPLFRMGEFDVAGLGKTEMERIQQAWKMREGEPFNRRYLLAFTQVLTEQELLPEGRKMRLEQSEGEQPNVVDVTLVVCPAGDPCQGGRLAPPSVENP